MRDVKPGEFASALKEHYGGVLQKRGVEDSHKSGGVMRVARADRLLDPLILERFGSASEERFIECCRHAEEKTLRLAAHPHHISGFQSAKRDENAWGGSIRAGQYIIAVAGLPWRMDEALALLVARHVGLLSLAEARSFAEMSDNHFYMHMPVPAHLMQAHL